ncbi:MAG TPA: hypothetical protein VFW00_01670 [Rhodocyclaceae bacterium]|nr:hypothetical protein [Rhodocyclaceae bacterium]
MSRHSVEHPLDPYNGALPTRAGAVFPGQRAVFRGCDLHRDLAEAEWLDIYLFSVAGRRYTSAQLRLLGAIWSYTSYPDTRLWNNRVAALAGSTRSTGNLGLSAALAVSEAAIFGRQIDFRAMDFLHRAMQIKARGGSLQKCIETELHDKRSMAGYGRPLVSGDERIGPIMALARKLDLADGPYQLLAREIEEILLAGRWRLHMNYAGLAAALCADLGLSPREYYLYLYPAFLAGMVPCYLEAMDKPPAAIMPLRIEQVTYTGQQAREWIASKE